MEWEWDPLPLPLLLLVSSSSESLESKYEESESDSSLIQDPSPNFPASVEDDGPPRPLAIANDDVTVVCLAPPLPLPLVFCAVNTCRVSGSICMCMNLLAVS